MLEISEFEEVPRSSTKFHEMERCLLSPRPAGSSAGGENLNAFLPFHATRGILCLVSLQVRKLIT